MKLKKILIYFFLILPILFSIAFAKPPKRKTSSLTENPMVLDFDQWINFVKSDWSDQKNKSKEYLKAVEEKCKKTQKIVKEFINENLNFLNQNDLWEDLIQSDKIDALKKLKKKILKNPVDLNTVPRDYFIKPKNIFITSVLPVAEKLIVPRNSKVFVFGDFHGNFDAIEKLFQNFIKRNVLNEQLEIKGDNYFIFLGDYVDRGRQGIEILLTLFRLKIQNQKKVILIRGNHETLIQNLTDGFIFWSQNTKGELLTKMSYLETKKSNELINLILFSYEFMPITVFLGYENGIVTKFIELSHGAIDHRYNPQKFLDSASSKDESMRFSEIKLENFMDLKSVFKNYEEIERQPQFIEFSFNWSDIDSNPLKNLSVNLSGRGIGFKYNTKFIDKYFNEVSSDKSKIELLIRAHEHAMPYQMRKDRIGAFPIGDTAITVMSGIYETDEVDFSWKFLNYYPTFLELTPPQTNQGDWNIEIKYLKNGKEETDDKFEFIGEKKEAAEKILRVVKKNLQNYKQKRDEERKEIDEKIKDLKIDEQLQRNDLDFLLNEISDLDKNKKERTELSKLIKEGFWSTNYFGGNNKEFADFILTLKIKANYQDYLNQKLKELVEERKNKLSPKDIFYFEFNPHQALKPLEQSPSRGKTKRKTTLSTITEEDEESAIDIWNDPFN
ncbi:MAG: metallophosphoesterase [bacterium]